MLCRCRNLANGAKFGFAIFFEVDSPLGPCPQVRFVFPWDAADHLSVGVPVDACNQVLMVLFTGQPGGALGFGFLQQCTFKLPPWILDGDLIFHQVWSSGSVPSVDVIDLPIPLHHICYGCSHGSSYHIPWVLFLVGLIVNLSPRLFEVLDLFWRPGVVECVHGLDVVQNDLISRVHVLVAMQVIGAVQEPSCMMAQMGSKCLSEGCSISWSKTLCFYAPECHWLYTSFV